jgi:hypothetical protein
MSDETDILNDVETNKPDRSTMPRELYASIGVRNRHIPFTTIPRTMYCVDMDEIPMKMFNEKPYPHGTFGAVTREFESPDEAISSAIEFASLIGATLIYEDE